ncbi:MAG: hypothetical protein ACRD0K_28500 [Egibacteraceae bacterium]
MRHDVRFDHTNATALAAELRAMARVIDDKAGERSRVGARAAQEWRGAYRQRFDQRLAACVHDGRTLAGELRAAAHRLDEAAQAARAEQTRRDRARPWYEQAWDAITPG